MLEWDAGEGGGGCAATNEAGKKKGGSGLGFFSVIQPTSRLVNLG